MAKKKAREVKKPKPKEEQLMDGLGINFEDAMKKILSQEKSDIKKTQ